MPQVSDRLLENRSDNIDFSDRPKGVWNTIETLEPGSVIFECKEGPFVEHEVDGILNLDK